VFPANIKHAIEHVRLPPAPDSWWYHGPRLALQPVLVWWAVFCAEVVDWPFKAKFDQVRMKAVRSSGKDANGTAG
jgi:hypothetical protein